MANKTTLLRMERSQLIGMLVEDDKHTAAGGGENLEEENTAMYLGALYNQFGDLEGEEGGAVEKQRAVVVEYDNELPEAMDLLAELMEDQPQQ